MNTNWPQHSNSEITKVIQILKSGRTNYLFGNEGKAFEKEFAKFSNTEYAVALSNGTVALDLALKSLKLKKGSEVIVTPRSFIASASCILLNNLKPKFIDVDLDSHNISPKEIEKSISKRTSAIICVHLGGTPCDMPEIMRIAKKNKLFVIEDCSQAHGAKIHNKSIGSYGNIATWSFCYDKIISTGGEGGMITTNQKKLYEFCWSYKDHGKNKNKYKLARNSNNGQFKFLHDSLGSNFRMLELQSAIGRIQLRKINQNIKNRKRIAFFIKENLRNSKIYTFQKSKFLNENVYYRLYINIDKVSIKRKIKNLDFLSVLLSNDIQCGVGSCSEIYREKSFKNIKIKLSKYKTAKYLSQYSFAIFINHYMSIKYAKKIVKFLKILEKKYSK